MKLHTGPGTVSVIPTATQQRLYEHGGSCFTSQRRLHKLSMPTKCFFQMKMKPDDRGEKESFICGLHPTPTTKRCLS